MIFDLTRTATQETFRYKPRNKATCRGILLCHGEEVGHLATLALVESAGLDVVGGHFTLEWYRQASPGLCDQLDIDVRYEDPTGTKHWYLPDIQVIYEGAVLAISSLDDLLGAPQTFFGTRMEYSVADHQSS